MTETKQWMGLHNPERHGQEGQGRARLWCECGSWCSEDALCDCCELVELRAEVERLERAEAAIERVRELRDRFRDHEKWASYRNVETLLTRALDGDA